MHSPLPSKVKDELGKGDTPPAHAGLPTSVMKPLLMPFGTHTHTHTLHMCCFFLCVCRCLCVRVCLCVYLRVCVFVFAFMCLPAHLHTRSRFDPVVSNAKPGVHVPTCRGKDEKLMHQNDKLQEQWSDEAALREREYEAQKKELGHQIRSQLTDLNIQLSHVNRDENDAQISYNTADSRLAALAVCMCVQACVRA